MKRKSLPVLIVLIAIAIAAAVLAPKDDAAPSISAAQIPPYSGQIYVVLNDNRPEFTQEDMQSGPYEYYSDLDALGRCGYAMACLHQSLMPTDDREGIGHIKPSGWQTYQYDFVDGKYLYNRCHLIGFQLAGENDNDKNLITGTRAFNVSGMLPFENMVADYMKETGNRVLYRVTPVYTEEALVAYGVRIEALSIEDEGEGICFHVFVYNVQPGVVIDYPTGTSTLDEAYLNKDAQEYILNVKSKRFHKPTCADATTIKPENAELKTISRELLIAQGYKPCGSCKP